MEKNNRIESMIHLDQKLRKFIAEYYLELNKLNDSATAIKLLAGHVAIMVEMINDMKK